MTDILLVDDHPIMRRLLREMLASYSDLRVIGEAETGEEAVKQVAQLQPAVVIMDIHLPTLNGIQATKLIKVQSPSTIIIALTAGEPRLEETELALAAGAASLVNKADAIDLLYPTIAEAVTRLRTSQPIADLHTAH